MKHEKETVKRKVLVAVFGMILAVGLLTGCQKGGKQTGKEHSEIEQSQGRYTAQTVELPMKKGEQILGAVKDGNVVEVYVSEGTLGELQNFYSYTWDGNSWGERKENIALNRMQEEQVLQMNRIFAGLDGRVYGHAVTLDTEKIAYGSHILQMKEDGSGWEDITPAPLLKTDAEGYTTGIPDAAVLTDGTLCVMNWNTEQIEVYREGKNVISLDTASANTEWIERISTSSDTLAVVGADNASVSFYQTSDFASVGQVKMEIPEENFTLLPGENGIWYMLDAKGIHRFSAEGSIVETILDGSYGQMSNTEMILETVWYEGEEQICAIYRNYSENTLTMEKYFFDEELTAVPEEKLTVYSLKENKTVAQAVNVFQQENPEIKIEYSFSFEEGTYVSNEQIRTLNTQLLNGEGADVLILDGLPIQAYMEKGILADLSGMKEELTAEGVFLDVIGNTAEKDGKIYGIPARIVVPVAYGAEEAYQALQSLEQLNQYLEQNPGKWLLTATFHDWAARELLAVMYDEVMADGKIQEEKMIQLIDCWQKICETMNTRELEGGTEYNAQEYAGIENFFMQLGVGLSDNSQACLVLTELNSDYNMDTIWYEMRDRGLEPKSISQYYIPRTIGGINASSAQQELAEQFLNVLMGEQIQSSLTNDGLPVTEKGWEQLVSAAETKKEGAGMGVSTIDFVTGEEIEVTLGSPTAEEVKKTEEFVKTLTTPFLPDRVFWETALEEMEKCYEGTETAETAAQAVARKMETYLAE